MRDRRAGKRAVRAFIAVIGLLLPVQVWAVQATLVADTHVSSSQASVNAGALSNVNVGGGYTGLLQFDLGVLPAGTTAAQIARATLRVYCNRADTPGTVSLLPVYGSWTELGVTSSSAPVLGTPVSTAQVGTANAFVTFDVTAMVQGWVNAPGSNFGLALSSGSAVVQFDSKENDQTSHPAQLEIALAAANSATGGGGATGGLVWRAPPAQLARRALRARRVRLGSSGPRVRMEPRAAPERPERRAPPVQDWSTISGHTVRV